MGRLFGTDGIRGIFGGELNSALARYVGRALVDVLSLKEKNKPTVLVGMDTRLSSPLLADSLIEGICECGGNAVNVEVCPTPAVAYLVTKYGYDAGVMISASHNPCDYNGIKIFGPDGYKLSDSLENEIEKIVLDGDTEHLRRKDQGKYEILFSGIDEYVEYIKESFMCRLDGMKLAIDCANGSASVSAERIFSGLGADCLMLADDPDGVNINKDCGSTHLDRLKKAVIDNELDLGIAFDGDADRCLCVDENGQEVDGDAILAILGSRLKKEGKLKNNTIVGTVMSNLGLTKFCKENGIDFISTKVGDRYVLEALNEGSLSLGGEQSGHIILRDLATTGDGQLTALALLSYIKESGKSLSALAGIMKKYPQYITSIYASAEDKQNFNTDSLIKKILIEAENEMGDSGRILVRPSGTEHLIRIMTEHNDPTVAEEVCASISKSIRKRLAELK